MMDFISSVDELYYVFLILTSHVLCVFWNFALIGYLILSWSLEWSLLLSSSSNSGRCTNLRARLCLQGMKLVKRCILFSISEFR